MDYVVGTIAAKINKPFLSVDYNELIGRNTVMLSQADTKNDFFGNPIILYEGLAVVGYQEDEDIDGNRDDIIMEGICIRNQTGHFEQVKWLLKADEKGIQYVSGMAQSDICS
ncbi:hypothetical protein ACYULU_04625 [Breznakiellaceae bacterium SP9]